jgi:hypothetical protein
MNSAPSPRPVPIAGRVARHADLPTGRRSRDRRSDPARDPEGDGPRRKGHGRDHRCARRKRDVQLHRPEVQRRAPRGQRHRAEAPVRAVEDRRLPASSTMARHPARAGTKTQPPPMTTATCPACPAQAFDRARRHAIGRALRRADGRHRFADRDQRQLRQPVDPGQRLVDGDMLLRLCGCTSGRPRFAVSVIDVDPCIGSRPEPVRDLGHFDGEWCLRPVRRRSAAE